ncbi:cytochrome P450 [Gephyromycinifex aptenodytis]|uniref:cytochrome P450 n=1 Tax=Gephyromycinifex aptenodytis TaxID=2716227 RepID=UPI001445518C|nr:cytochrome P450 [Gephyromycinifex aptenodytis]
MTTAPVPAAHCVRKTSRADEPAGRAVEYRDGVWHVRSALAVRQVLREGNCTIQAGFNVDQIREGNPAMRQPILFLDGPEHRAQRSAIARYFAPATVSKRYRELMESLAQELVDEVARGGVTDLSAVTLRYSVEVAAQVIGLTNSDMGGMSKRLESFFAIPPQPPAPAVKKDGELGAGQRRSGLGARAAQVRSLAGRFDALVASARGAVPMGLFYMRDVRPAIAARRKEPQEDVISHLLAQGYKDHEILIECITYAAAGMVTTREFISVAAWHLLDNAELRQAYLQAPEKQRYAILHEVLRLEPVVGHLYRRAINDLVLVDGQHEHQVRAGELLDLYIRSANADPVHVGPEPLSLCPARDMSPGLKPEVMAFGDGNHRCPGSFLAVQESDIFLQRLLRLPLSLVDSPRIDWVDLIAGYELRDVLITVENAADVDE